MLTNSKMIINNIPYLIIFSLIKLELKMTVSTTNSNVNNQESNQAASSSIKNYKIPRSLQGKKCLAITAVRNILKPIKENGSLNKNHISLSRAVTSFNSLNDEVNKLESGNGNSKISRLWKNKLSEDETNNLIGAREFIDENTEAVQQICARRQAAIEAYNNGAQRVSKNDQLIRLQQTSNGPSYYKDAFNTPFFKAVNTEKVESFNQLLQAALTQGNGNIHGYCTVVAELLAEAAVYIHGVDSLLEQTFLEQEKLAYETLSKGGVSVSNISSNTIVRSLEVRSQDLIDHQTQFTRLQKRTIPTQFYNLFNNAFFKSLDIDRVEQFNSIWEKQNNHEQIDWKLFCKLSQDLFTKASYIASGSHTKIFENMLILAQRCPLIGRLDDHLTSIENRCEDFSVPFSKFTDEAPVSDTIDYFMLMVEQYSELKCFGNKQYKDDMIVWRKNAELSPTTDSWKIARNPLEDPYFHISYAPGIIEAGNGIYVSETLSETKIGAWKTLWDKNIGCIVNLRENNEASVNTNDQTHSLAYGPQTINEERTYGEITVKLVNETDHYTNKASNSVVTKREYLLTCNGEEKTVTQLHIRCWEDRMVPDASAMLFTLKEALRNFEYQSVLFHCKSGIGRAGTARILFNYYRHITLITDVFKSEESPEEFKKKVLEALGELKLEKLYMYTLFIRDQIQGSEQMTFMRHMIREMTLLSLGQRDHIVPFPGMPAPQLDRNEKGENLSISEKDVERAKKGEPVGRPQDSANTKTFYALLSLQGSNRSTLQQPTEEQAGQLIKGLHPDDAFNLMMRVEKLKRSESLAAIIQQIISSGQSLAELETKWSEELSKDWSALTEENKDQLNCVVNNEVINDPNLMSLLTRRAWGFRQLMLTGNKEELHDFLQQHAPSNPSSIAASSH
jgi:protein tyrosine phosphatase